MVPAPVVTVPVPMTRAEASTLVDAEPMLSNTGLAETLATEAAMSAEAMERTAPSVISGRSAAATV